MKAWEIADLKDFTSKLFLKETFDSFELVEADFHTEYGVTLDGHKTEQEKGEPEYTAWQKIRPLAFQIIKGNRLPHSFHITLRLSDDNTANTLKSVGLPYTTADVGGLFLNIRYDNRKCTLVTGFSFRTFILDKTLEKEWDRVIHRFLRHHQIPVSEL